MDSKHSNKNERSGLLESIRTGLDNNKSITSTSSSDYESFDNNKNNDHHRNNRQFYSTLVFVVVAVIAVCIVTYSTSTTSPGKEYGTSGVRQQHHKVVAQLGASSPSSWQYNGDESVGTTNILQATHGLQLPGYSSSEIQIQYEKDLQKINWDDVTADIAILLKDSKDWWPADYGSYGPLMIRLSWHSCGSYRTSDGRGGCDGGSQRYDPERSWPDNTNLDKARRLLQPIKEKYGNGVSWGDLFALVGTVAIHEMGGPHIGFCAGRQDVQDNGQTLSLGPSIEQEQFGQCPINGQCPYPLGSNTVGLVRFCFVFFSL
jgi:catalase (peroxidase I)